MSATAATSAVAGAPGATAAPIGGAPAAQPAAPAASAPWYGDIPDMDLRGWTETKGWKTPLDALKSHREAEKLIGVPKDQLLRLPAPTADQKTRDETMSGIYNALGRPPTPDLYQLKAIEGDEDSAKFVASMRPILHQHGLTQSQAAGLQESWNQYIQNSVAEQDRVQAQKEQVELDGLKREWPGDTFTQRTEMARRAVTSFVNPMVGNAQEAEALLGQIEDSIGTAKFLKLFSSIGQKISESTFVGDKSNSTFGMTPAQAHSRIQQMKSDPATAKQMLQTGSAEWQEFDRLTTIAAQGVQR